MLDAVLLGPGPIISPSGISLNPNTTAKPQLLLTPNTLRKRRRESSDLRSAIPISDPPGFPGRAMFSRGWSIRVESVKKPDDYADVSMPGDEEDVPGETTKSSMAGAKPVTMSLMDLLEETDRQMGLTGSRYAMDEDDEDEEDGVGDGEFDCCVCGVKIKGAAFIPCGHTFCQLCSKDLMVQKGHCPVCSCFIIEFLEIF
ncbi:PREDICTED: E3 ubiquitin-protein ligase RNF8-like [Tarenaya hassleriana]|uniref:E3 ubiquitin-protein ligase RNF8-like n=1 Tax=Tarenaya hassleriana TaxID=28532 RepID=UPI00053C103D|nr:PREDICTED: E3 ubiquitin-protein ligase RNF8-like [Tarenaya hassleriana]